MRPCNWVVRRLNVRRVCVCAEWALELPLHPVPVHAIPPHTTTAYTAHPPHLKLHPTPQIVRRQDDVLGKERLSMRQIMAKLVCQVGLAGEWENGRLTKGSRGWLRLGEGGRAHARWCSGMAFAPSCLCPCFAAAAPASPALCCL